MGRKSRYRQYYDGMKRLNKKQEPQVKVCGSLLAKLQLQKVVNQNGRGK